MTKRARLLLAGAAFVLVAFIPGSAGANTAGGHDGCRWDTETPSPASY